MANTPEINPCDMQEQIDRYVESVQQMQEDYFKAMNYTFSDPPTITVDYGNKYARIVKNDGLNGGRSVHSFVNMSNGDILKGSWKAPIRTKKGLAVRGNIFAPDVSRYVNEHGPHYLRR
tara:strand:- start:286 stop:642 length:357 start_codon:yes stop_codon:yes gene_type:complete